jgi:hypothetical protein
VAAVSELGPLPGLLTFMSALAPKADIRPRDQDVTLGPTADSCTATKIGGQDDTTQVAFTVAQTVSFLCSTTAFGSQADITPNSISNWQPVATVDPE